MKVSYSTTENMQQEIINHNKKILNQNDKQQKHENKCNCTKKDECPLEGKWAPLVVSAYAHA